MPLTDVQIRNIKPPEKGQKTYPDTGGVRGLSLRVSVGGAKTFCFTTPTDRTRRRITLGRYGLGGISLSEARKAAATISSQITLGTYKEQRGLSFSECFDLYKANKLPHNRVSTAKETERLLRKALSRYGQRPLSEITTPNLAAYLDKDSEKSHSHSAVSCFFNWCVRRGYIEDNPLRRLQKPRMVPRERTLLPPDLKRVLLASQTLGRYGQLIRFLIYTGQRLGQAHALTEAHIDRDKMTLSWPSSQMKQNRPHSIPYGPLTAELIGKPPNLYTAGEMYISPIPFTKTERYHARLVKAAGVEHFTRHDLRRSYATVHASLGTPQHIVERLLAHATPGGSAIHLVYNRFQFWDEQKAACHAYEQFLCDLLDGTAV